jgi:uncharacterized membrane protein
MHEGQANQVNILPLMGCMTVLALFGFLCLAPFFFIHVLEGALLRLHLSQTVAGLCVVGILLGSLVNIPVYRIQREHEQYVDVGAVFGMSGVMPGTRRMRPETIIALNVGGGLIPIALAIWQMRFVIEAGGQPLTTLLIAAAANIAVCYKVARLVNGMGIMMPGFVAPLAALIVTWLMLPGEAYDLYRAPVAFTAGVLGPLVGADLLHLKDITRISVGMLSIGGAGTFDGIVLSGILAALLA